MYISISLRNALSLLVYNISCELKINGDICNNFLFHCYPEPEVLILSWPTNYINIYVLLYFSAADLYIKDYLHPFVQDNHPEAKPLRVYYKHRWLKTVHPTVLQYCLVGTAGEQNGVVPNYGPVFRHPTIADMESVRVVVSTLRSSQYVYHKEMEPGMSGQV